MREFAICSRAAGLDIVGDAPASTVISIFPLAKSLKSCGGHPISMHLSLNFLASESDEPFTRRRIISANISPI